MGGTRSRCGLRQEAGSVASCPTVKTAHPRETLLVGGADSSVPLAQFPQGRTRQGRRQRGRGGGSGQGQQSGGETAGCKPGRVVGPRRRGRPRAAFGAGCRQAREPGGVRPAEPRRLPWCRCGALVEVGVHLTRVVLIREHRTRERRERHARGRPAPRGSASSFYFISH